MLQYFRETNYHSVCYKPVDWFKQDRRNTKMVEIPAEFDSFRDYVDIFSHLYLWEYFSRIVSKGDRRNVEVGRREEAEVNVLKYGKQRVACWVGYLSLKYTPVTKRGGKKKQKKTVEVFLEHPNNNQID
jgi:hypothetical protein